MYEATSWVLKAIIDFPFNFSLSRKDSRNSHHQKSEKRKEKKENENKK